VEGIQEDINILFVVLGVYYRYVAGLVMQSWILRL
jgi:hypothetical protein